jgi:hypothetical protein
MCLVHGHHAQGRQGIAYLTRGAALDDSCPELLARDHVVVGKLHGEVAAEAAVFEWTEQTNTQAACWPS